MCFLGACGVDRCYMGQVTLGIVKGLTCGGCCVWTCLDWVVITITMLSWSTSLNVVGYHANFEPGWTIHAAAVFTMAMLLFNVSGGVVNRHLVIGRKLSADELEALRENM
eukprot:TRINITY_DN106490_c0_g1_i1.p2 TRINITY_DN106490_c0_g1~~TRINITY_DN106490_c0_g1_i1.p2  ORF type:complete len:110 (-),score=8.96 TRINITY_DN106490_c0_g1_i1:52-381(-)